MKKIIHNAMFRDEKEWIDKSTKPIDNVLPMLDRNRLFKIVFVSLALIFLFIKFHKLFITLIAAFFISYVRFKRTKMKIDVEIEPSYLIAIAITLAFGINYGVVFILLPMLTTVIYGISIGFLVSFANKVVVIIAVNYYWDTFHNPSTMIFVATAMVLLTDIIGYFFRKKFGQSIVEIIQLMATNTILRYSYFSLFLDLVLKLIG
jgi:hypothetical protein